ncbi:MAG: hypothetical protein QMB94_12325, partial [Phycisphaerales bacterium]
LFAVTADKTIADAGGGSALVIRGGNGHRVRIRETSVRFGVTEPVLKDGEWISGGMVKIHRWVLIGLAWHHG